MSVCVRDVMCLPYHQPLSLTPHTIPIILVIPVIPVSIHRFVSVGIGQLGAKRYTILSVSMHAHGKRRENKWQMQRVVPILIRGGHASNTTQPSFITTQAILSTTHNRVKCWKNATPKCTLVAIMVHS